MLDNTSRRFLSLTSWLLALALAGGCSGDGAEFGAADQAPDTSTSTELDGDADLFDAGDTSGGNDVSEGPTMRPTLEASMGGMEASEAVDPRYVLTQTRSADLNGDGFHDLVGLAESGELVVKLLYPEATSHPPFVYNAEQVVTTGFRPTQLMAGDFDGDGRNDVAALDPATGELGVALNIGRGLLRAPVRFTETGLVFRTEAFEDPLVALDWLVGDVDGNGTQDMIFVGDGALHFALFGEPDADVISPLAAVFVDAANVKGFEDPLVAVKGGALLELDGTPGIELAMVFDAEDGRAALGIFDVALGRGFDDPIIAFDDPIIAFDDPIIAFESVPLPRGAHAITAMDADLDGATDLAVLVTRGDFSAVQLFTSGTAFEDPLVAFEDPLVAFEDPLVAFEDPLVAFEDPLVALRGAARAAFQGNFARMWSTRMLGLMTALNGGQSAGPGASSAMQLVMYDDASKRSTGLDFAAGRLSLANLQLDVTMDLARASVADFNGDGFGEFVAVGPQGFQVAAQLEVIVPPNAVRGDELDWASDDNAPMAESGGAAAVCDVSAPYCAQGARGVCDQARLGCTSACEGDDQFDSEFQQSESACDGLDNDCDGRVDVIAQQTLTIDGFDVDGQLLSLQLLPMGPDELVVLDVDGGGQAVPHVAFAADLGAVPSLNAQAISIVRPVSPGRPAAPIWAASDGTTVHLVGWTASGLLHSSGTSAAGFTTPLPVSGVNTEPSAAGLGVLGAAPVLVHAEGGALYATDVQASTTERLFELAGGVAQLDVHVAGSVLIAVVRTLEDKLLVLALDREAGTLRLLDLHQPMQVAGDLRLVDAAADATAATACVAFLEAPTDALQTARRLRALEFAIGADRVTPGAVETISLRDVVDGSVTVAATPRGCQVAWLESVGSDSLGLARNVFFGEELPVQELEDAVPTSKAAFATFGDVAQFVRSSGATVLGNSMTLNVSTLCGNAP